VVDYEEKNSGEDLSRTEWRSLQKILVWLKVNLITVSRILF